MSPGLYSYIYVCTHVPLNTYTGVDMLLTDFRTHQFGFSLQLK